jgi:hypothetical protein
MRCFRCRCALLVLFGLLAGSAPAAAQFGGIFGDPPRPPSNVPNRPPVQDDRFAPQYPPPQYPQYPQPVPPPAQAMPAPPPPGPSGPPSGIQSQPLAPPPGIAVQPAAAPPAPLPGPAGPNAAPGQRQPPRPGGPGAPAAPADTAALPSDEVVMAPSAQKIVNPTAVFSGLDKITGRITSFDVAINETVQFGALQVTPRACYTRPPTETQNTDAFVAVDEVTLQGEVKRIFTGWMFAASPGLHGVEHPIYDVWLTDCKGGSPPVAQAQVPAPAPAPAPARQRSPQRPPPPRYGPPR